MFKKLPNLFSWLLAAFSITAVTAQDYVTMPVSSGYNADVIANGVGTALATTSIDIDGAGFNYVATDWKLTSTSTPITYGVPATGIINSIVAATPGLSYQLGPLTGNNSLRLATGGTTSGTITFATPIQAVTLYMLAVTGSGNGTVSAIVTFTDGTTQPFSSLAVSDWYNGANAAIQGIGRIGRGDSVLEANSVNPRMYQINMGITAANQPKFVQSVTLTKTSTGTEVVNIFAFSADKLVTCGFPTNIVAVPSMDGATVTWTPPVIVPSGGYEYLITTTATTPSATATAMGTVAAGTNTKTVTGLIPGLLYYFWIRSNCGTEKGSWKQTSFYAGQVSFTYTTADIPTLNLAVPTPTSATTCPGVMSITVPAGYKIKTIGTSYRMTALGDGWMSEQRSLLYCTTTNLGETTVYAGTANNAIGTVTYDRTNIPIANNLTGTVNFELRAWRTYAGTAGCNTLLNKVDNNTWKIHAVLESLTCTTPATPSSTAHTMCPSALFGETVVNGIPGAVYKWYTQPTGGTALTVTDQIFTGTFYVTQTVGTCESARSAGFVITASGTANPTAAPQTLCGGTTVANLQTTGGTNVKWYAAATGGTQLAASTPLATGNYYVSQTLNNCESARTTVAITINTTPPPVAGDQIFCAGSGATVANLQATLVTGGTISWYATETSTTPLASTAVLGSGTYYATQTLGVCESVRVPVAVAVATVVAPVGNPIEVCEGATVANLQGDGSPSATYKWFATQDSTTPLALDTPVTNGTYYVNQTLGLCEGPKAAVQVTVNNIAAPEVADQEFCAGATVAALQATPATGAAIKWYQTETSGTPLSAYTSLVSGTYYVSQKLNLCESDRTAVEITVYDVVPALNTPTLGVCIGSTIGDLTMETAEGATLKWYVSNGATTPLAAGTNVTATTYYVTQSLGECESAKAPVEISFNVIALPTTTNLEVCTGTTFAELAVEGTEGASFSWYATNEDIIELDEAGVVSAGTYYVSQTVEGCEGGRVPVAVSLIFTESPSPTLTQAFCGDAFVSDLVSGANDTYAVNWYSSEGELLTAESSLATGTYTVSQTANGCESLPVAVSVIMTGVPGLPDGATEQDFTAGQTTADLEVEFADNVNVQWFFLDEDAWINIPAGTPLVDGGVYGVQQSIGTCESDILAITVNMILSGAEFELSNLSIYPNPASDVLTIEGKETLSEIVVINLLGQRVLNKQINAASTQINVSALPQATYILQVYGVNGGTASFKIVKQ